MLTNDQLENIGGHHVEVAANDFGNAKISYDQSEADQGRRNQTVLGTWQGDGEKLSLWAGAQCIGCLVKACIGQREGGDQDHEHMRKDGKTFGHHDAWCTINLINPNSLHGIF